MKIGSCTITKVEERKRVVKGHKNEKGDAVLDEENTGWWIVSGELSFWVGNEKPDIKEGDLLILSVEKSK